MRIALRVAARVALPPEAVYAWWTDYQPDDHDGAHFAPFRWGAREILARDESARVLRFRDPGRAFGKDTGYESWLRYDPPRAVHETSEGPIGRFTATYAFEPDGEGTLIVWTIDGHVTAPWAARLARVPGAARLAARADLAGHVRDLKRDAREGRVQGVEAEEPHVGEW